MRLKIITIFLVLFFLSGTLPAQEKFASYKLSPEQLVTRDAKLFIDDKGNLLADIFCFAGSTRLLFHETEPPVIIYHDSIDGKKDAAANVLKDLKNARTQQRIATISANGIYDDCYYSPRKETLYFVEINALSNQAVTNTVKLRSNEHFACSVTDSGTIYLLTYSDKSNSIFIYTKRTNTSLQTRELELKLHGGENTQQKKTLFFSEFFNVQRDGPYIVCDYKDRYPASTSAIRKKVYHLPGKLVFTVEKFSLQTNVVTLYLNDLRVLYHSVPPPIPVNPEVVAPLRTCGTFLLNDVLYKTGVSNDVFFISAINVYSGQAVCNYTNSIKHPDSIIKASFFRSAVFNEQAANKKRLLESYLQQATISVSKIPGDIVDIEISSDYQSISAGQALLSLAASVTGTYLINSIPDAFGFSFFWFKHKKEVAINNSVDLNTGLIVNKDKAPAASTTWNDKMNAVNKFIEQYEYREDKAQAVISGNTIFVYVIEPNGEELQVYRF